MSQINLLNKDLFPQDQRFGIQSIALVIVLTVLLIIIWTLFDLGRIKEQAQQLSAAQQLLSEKTRELEIFSAQFPEAELRAEQERQLANLEQELNQKQRLLNTIRQNSSYSDQGYYSYLESLAKNRVDGLWLDHIEIADGTQQVRLRGFTLKAEYIPLFLDALNQSPFEDIAFETLAIERTLFEGQTVYRFELASTPTTAEVMP